MAHEAPNNEPRIRHDAIPFQNRDSHAHLSQPFDTASPDAIATTRLSSNCPTVPHQYATPGTPELDRQRLQAFPRFAEPFRSHGSCIPCWLESHATPDTPELDQQRLQASPRFAEPFTSYGGCVPCWLKSRRMYNPNCIHRRSQRCN
ncbi:hypothetical protein VDGD_20182 [Verticillium dahliae]|nr:hypothetical protein VDGD_20182 [Verticillium dahliae]